MMFHYNVPLITAYRTPQILFSQKQMNNVSITELEHCVDIAQKFLVAFLAPLGVSYVPTSSYLLIVIPITVAGLILVLVLFFSTLLQLMGISMELFYMLILLVLMTICFLVQVENLTSHMFPFHL